MKLAKLPLVAAVILSGFARAGNADDDVTPLNPAFVAWRDARNVSQKKANQSVSMTASASAANAGSGRDSTSAGFIPSPIDRSYLRAFYRNGRAIRKGRKDLGAPLSGGKSDELAVSYNVKGKDLTPVKDQGNYGTCWVHATMGCIETELLRKENRLFDLSENNMSNLHGYDNPFAGGNADKATAYLVRWAGPVLEIEDPYPNKGGSPRNLSPVRHVQKVLWLPYRENALDNATIKYAVREYGAVFATYHHQGEGTSGGVDPYKDSPYWKADEAAYYMGSYQQANHAVCIVGWDDNYPASKFSSRPSGDGAFLIKNSWGTDWGKAGMEGFEWISYYDATLCGHDESHTYTEPAYVFTSVEAADNYDAVCGHDELGAVAFYGNSSKPGTRWGAAQFTAENDVNVAAVGIYLPEPFAEYEIYVYGGCDANKPRSGTQIGSTIGDAGEYAGFRTIHVSCNEKVRRGQTFSIVVKIATEASNQLAVEYAERGWSSGATVKSGETFFSIDGQSWTDFAEIGSAYNFCCKAFLKNAEDPAAASYAVRFDANGGVGHMSGATMKYGTAYVLPSCAFARAGYDFTGWFCEQTEVVYAAGDRISFVLGELDGDALTLKAMWGQHVSAVPDAPEITDCTDAASTRVSLHWTAVPGAAKYNVYYSRSDVFANAILVDTVIGKTAYEHYCSPGYRFYYWVTAVSAEGVESKEGKCWVGYRVPELDVARNTYSFDANGGSDKIVVAANSRWKVTASEPWIDVGTASQAEETKELVFSVAKNSGLTGRNGCIKVELLCGDADDYCQEIKIVQAGEANPLPSSPQWKKYVYTSDGVYLEWEPAANATSYRLYRKITYPTMPETSPFLRNEELLADNLKDTCYVDVSAKGLGISWTYRVEAVNGTGAASSEKVTVMGNLFGEAAISWSADSQTFAKEGGTANVSVTLVGAKEFDLISSANWLKAEPVAGGFRATAAANASSSQRFGTITICCGKMLNYDGTTTYLSKATVSFTQAACEGSSPELDDDAYVATVGAGGGRGGVTVNIPSRGKYVFDLSGRPNWVTRVQLPSDVTGSSSYAVEWQSTGSMPFTFTCKLNVGGERTWAIPFTADGMPAGCVVIRQRAPNGSDDDKPEPEGDPAKVEGDGTMYPTLTFAANGGRGTVRLATRASYEKWGYDFSESWYGRPTWVTYMELDGGIIETSTSELSGWSSVAGAPQFTFEVAANPTADERTYRIGVEHYLTKDSETADRQIGEITIVQAAGSVMNRTPPDAVTGLSARTDSQSAISLSWNRSERASFYKVLRAPMGRSDLAEFEVVDDHITSTSYVDAGLPAGSSYYYVIAACNDAGETLSEKVIGKTQAAPVSPTPSGDAGVKPAAPGKPYSNGLGAGSVSLAWDPAEGATTYKVLRAEGEVGEFKVIAFDLTSCTYGDNFLRQNEIYRYRIVAVNRYGETEGAVATFSTRALKFGSGEASEFMLSATERSTVIGVSSLVWSNFAQREYQGQKNEAGGSVGRFYSFDNPRIVDVEKNARIENSEDHDTDDYWCYPFSVLDALFWGGYMDGYATEDEIADELRSKRDTDGIISGIPYAREGSACVNYSTSVQDQSGLAAELVEQFACADKLLVMGVTFDESFIWKGAGGVGHAVVCCGYSLDAAKTDAHDPTILKGLYIIDPDNDMFNAGGAGAAPDSITYCPVAWNAQRKIYMISNVFGATGEVDLFGGSYIRAKNPVALENVNKTVNTAVMNDAGPGTGDGGEPGSSQDPAAKNTVTYLGLEGAANTNVTTFTTNDLPLALGPVEREGYKFLGWTPWDGVIPAGTASNVTFTALWEALANPDEPGVIVDPEPKAEDVVPVKAEEVTAALSYNGYLAKGDEIVGSVTVKVAKKAKVTATVQLPDGSGSKALKKFSYAGTLGENGSVELSCKKNGGTMSVTIGAKALSGTVAQGGETYAINGRLGTKEELSSVDSLLDKKVWSIALHTPSNGVPHALVNGYSALTVTGGKKGKVKVSGFLADGTKVSVSAQGTVFDSCVIVPVNAALYKGKAGGFSLKLKIEDEKFEVGNVSGWTAVVDGKPVTVKWDAVPASAKSDIGSGAAFHMDAADIPFDVVPPSADGTSTLPDGVKVDSVGGKWSLPKAGKVAFTKDKSDLDVSKFGENPAGLKLSYAAKTGAFKGSFSLYRQTAPGKLKKEKATVNGVVVNGVGYGSAVIKKTGSMPVTVK